MTNFDKFVKPIFDVAKVDSKMVASKNAKHIHEIVEAEDLSGEREKKNNVMRTPAFSKADGCMVELTDNH